jgi:hypothetical protein
MFRTKSFSSNPGLRNDSILKKTLQKKINQLTAKIAKFLLKDPKNSSAK